MQNIILQEISFVLFYMGKIKDRVRQMRSAKPLLVTILWHAGLMNTSADIWLYVNIPSKEHVVLPMLSLPFTVHPIGPSAFQTGQCGPKSNCNNVHLFIWKCQTLRHTLFWFHDNLKELITHFVPSSADIPNLRVCLSSSQFILLILSCVKPLL